ncbi:AprI/Inh family metalloprotease inhibitor [Pseudomonas fluorescens]|uniref:AprI/Inh family metalloprotease inhibitor n=1 Tax=Pseudomonas fluorescens TaxID=294 RepID=A0A944DLE4_PSEFL|nr:AprI/Inh family metalloprotease inhibitor [Pseudomonas fluorescens]MBT2298408.1 AprI/Inh family metalloprotease inhibitor [Pseudomonas fluorescens]MBT2309934.1 AprI/Inh family metalloprotease inhibitor [Pseudomonas fluorescens]MBT2310957.1 AprI/Inh family metalloprotease inhibitor [Pseudomonas fluorescens]MBT2320108.1 AprI/Inh family metalloprotease inhibitor [Pseudomonas fluorescens]MBT2328864.1 AprI/Inh family metalloprotease inhibitor [Pseudomonas fluorescens]
MCRNPKPRGAQASAWLLATLMMFTGEVAMARSLLLAEPSQLAGQWQAVLSGSQAPAQPPSSQDSPSSSCLVELRADQTLGGQTACLGQWLGDEPVTWFTEPDGLSLIGKQNSRVHLQLHQEHHYQVTLKSGRVVTLERSPPPAIP